MPSLRDQLQSLQEPVTRSLGVEKERASLLFDRKEAASFSTEEFYNLGLSGLEQLRKVDRSLADYEEKLFDPSAVVLNRAMLSKTENDELNESLERMIVYLSPYFNHQGCKQVLEWLIHKYHIHLYNGPIIANAFVVYHSTNSFGRLLKILRIDRPEWEFTKEFSKEALPIPFASILKACLKGGANHFLLASYSAFLQQAIQLVGKDYVNERMSMHFTFFTSLVVHLFEDTAHITEQLISRVIPFVGAALKSKVLPFKMSGFMIVCDLVMNASLNEDTLTNILKLTMLKMQPEWFEVAMNVVLVICQRQNIKFLPQKPFIKLLRKGDSFNLNHYLNDAQKSFDLTGFVVPFVNTAFECIAGEEDTELRSVIASYITVIWNLETMNETQASAAIHACLNLLATSESVQVPEELRLLMKQIILRFAPTFDAIRAEMMITNKEVLNRLLEQCKIAEHEVGVLTFEDKKKRRRRSSHSRNYDEEHVEAPVEEDIVDKKVEISKKHVKIEDQLKNLQDGGDVQKSFKKAPSVVLEMLNGDEAVKKVEWALQAFDSDKYLARQLPDDLEDFVLATIRFASKNPTSQYNLLLRQALLKLKISDKLQLPLIMPYEEETSAKRRRLAKASQNPMHIFADETDPEFEARLIFALNFYNESTVLKATPALISQLFDLIDITDKPPKNYSTIRNKLRVQQLTLILICKFLKGQGAKTLINEQIHMDSLVNVIQFTHDSAVLRNALKVLTFVAPLIPVQLTTQIMSLFTFMGSGLMKKDNELTLMIVEEALHALFSAILTANLAQPAMYNRKLLEVSQIFAKSLIDIPAHRRSRILRTLAGCVSPDSLWIIFGAIFDAICIQWKKGANNEQPNDNLSNTCLEFIGTIEPEKQFKLALDILEYVVHLGGDFGKNDSLTDTKRFPLIFDRMTQPNQKLRHFRYMVIGFVWQIFKQPALCSQLAELADNNAIYERVSLIGEHLIEVLASLESFASKELSAAERNEIKARGTEASSTQLQTLKYWVALNKRTKSIITKICEVLPTDVRTRIVLKLVDDDEVDDNLKELAPKLLDVVLPSEAEKALAEQEPQSFEDQLNELIEKMNASLKLPTQLTKLTSSLEKLLILDDAAEQIEKLARQIFPLFYELFNIRLNAYNTSAPDEISESEQAISRAFIALAENLPEEELMPVFSQMSDWVSEALEAGSKLRTHQRVVTVYNFANKFYEHYNNLALSYFSQLFVYTPKILKQMNAAKKLFIDGTDEENSNDRAAANQLIIAVIDFINNCAKHSFFMGDDRAELVYEAVLDEIENYQVHGYEQRCNKHLVDCIYHLSESAPDLFMTSLCNKLLEKMHDNNSNVRLQALLIFEKLVGRIGDALAPLLPTVVQYLSELLDDPDTKVSEQCDATIRQLRSVFGDDILNDR